MQQHEDEHGDRGRHHRIEVELRAPVAEQSDTDNGQRSDKPAADVVRGVPQ